MFNNHSIVTESYVNVKQILANDHFVAVGAVIDNTAKNSDGMCLAGTPLTGDLLKRVGGSWTSYRPCFYQSDYDWWVW